MKFYKCRVARKYKVKIDDKFLAFYVDFYHSLRTPSDRAVRGAWRSGCGKLSNKCYRQLSNISRVPSQDLYFKWGMYFNEKSEIVIWRRFRLLVKYGLLEVKHDMAGYIGMALTDFGRWVLKEYSPTEDYIKIR